MSAKPTLVSLILDATAAGRAMLTAASAAAQKTLLSLTKSDVGLPNVDNTSDANKPVSTAQQTAIDAKIGGTVGTTDNRLVRSDGTGARTLQASGITVDDSDNVTTSGGVTATAFRTTGNTTQALVPSGGTWFIDGTGGIRYRDTSGYATVFRLDNNGDIAVVRAITASGLIGLGTYTVATLPSASANPRRIAAATDSSVTAYRTVVAGGGSNNVMVFSDGTNWLVI